MIILRTKITLFIYCSVVVYMYTVYYVEYWNFRATVSTQDWVNTLQFRGNFMNQPLSNKQIDQRPEQIKWLLCTVSKKNGFLFAVQIITTFQVVG